MRYRVTVLTPTLVGDGNKLSPIDYMVWRDTVNVLDQTRIFKLLARGPRLDGYLTQLRRATTLDFASWGGFAQNYADRRIPLEDASSTGFWTKAPSESQFIPTFAANTTGAFLPGAALKGALRTALVFSRAKSTTAGELAEKLKDQRLPRRPAEDLERQSTGGGGSDRMRAVSISDSASKPYENFRVYCLRLSTLVPKGPDQYALGWKQGTRALDAKMSAEATPNFAEMAMPGTVFEGDWRENDFLNREEVRQVLRWNKPVTHQTLFEAANQYAEKQIALHVQYARWTGMEQFGASMDALAKQLETARNEGKALLAIGWGAGFLSKSATIGSDDADQRKLLGMLPFYQRAIQTGLPFPKTRRVVFLKNRAATLPGWVEISVS